MPELQVNISREAATLGSLAMMFRGTRSAEERRAIANDYADVVNSLIHRGNWDEMPAPEDLLPDEFMPSSFFDYWQTADSRRLHPAAPGERPL